MDGVLFNYPDKLRCHSRRTRSGALVQEGKSSLSSSLPTLAPRSHLTSSKRRSAVARKGNHAPPIMGIPGMTTKTVQPLTRRKHLVTNPPMVSPLTLLLTLKRTAVTCHAQGANIVRSATVVLIVICTGVVTVAWTGRTRKCQYSNDGARFSGIDVHRLDGTTPVSPARFGS